MIAKYYVTLTEYGAAQVAQAHDVAAIELTQLVLGDANGIPYNPIDQKSRTTLIHQMAFVPVHSVLIDAAITTVTAIIPANIGGFNLHEIGLTDTTGQLVYIGNYHGGYKPVIEEGAGGDLTIIINITVESGKNALIHIDPNVVTASKQWVQDNFLSLPSFEQHLNDADPHNQYVLKTQAVQDFNANAQRIFPVNNCIITYDPTYNPAVALSDVLGANTKWRNFPFVPEGVTSASNIGKITLIGGGAENIATLGVIIWQRMPDDWVQPIAKIYYLNRFSTTPYNEFGWRDGCEPGSYYLIKMTAPAALPTQFKLVSRGKIVDAIFKDASGLLHFDDDGFAIIPVRRKPLIGTPYDLDPTKIELVLTTPYQHVCLQNDQKYRFLDRINDPTVGESNVAEIAVEVSKKYVKANDVIELKITRTETTAKTLYLFLKKATGIEYAPMFGDRLDLGGEYLRAVEYFDLHPSSASGIALEDAINGTSDDIYRLDFTENEVEKKIKLIIKDREILKRMNVLACIAENNNSFGVGLDYSNNFLIEKNTLQANYMLSYTILGTTITISLDTTLVAENTVVAWNISNYTGDPITPTDTTGEFTIDEEGHAEIAFTFNFGEEFSFEFGLTGRDEYVGVVKS